MYHQVKRPGKGYVDVRGEDADLGVPKVSVIIPLYNQKQFVGEAIESALGQDYPNIEIVVVDDGSTDDPASALRNYAGRIKVCSQKNKGLAGARNTGLAAATGDYIQFLDADDLLKPEKITRQMDYMLAHSDCPACYCNCIRFQESLSNTASYFVQRPGELEDPIKQLMDFGSYFPIAIHAALIKSEVFEVVGRFNESLFANEDREFWIRVVLKGKFPKYMDFDGIYYRKHERSMNRDAIQMCKGFLRFAYLTDSLLEKHNKLTKDVIAINANNCYLQLRKIIASNKDRSLEKELFGMITRYSQGDHYIPENAGKIAKAMIKCFGFEFYLKHILRT